jgi:hypothetical protein
MKDGGWLNETIGNLFFLRDRDNQKFEFINSRPFRGLLSPRVPFFRGPREILAL